MDKEILSYLNEDDFTLRSDLGIDQENTFGVEIEFENIDLDKIKCDWKLKEDDTVTVKRFDRVIGGEVISPILRDTEETWNEIDYICNYLIREGGIATGNTGAHIHIGSQILGNNPDNIRRLLKQWELFEYIIYRFSFGRDYYPRPNMAKQAPAISPRLYKIRNSKNGYNRYKSYYEWLNFFKKYNFSKFNGINFSNYRGYDEDLGNTIEIRCPNGTIDPIIWQNNINFFIKFLESCKYENCDEEYIDFLLNKKTPMEYNQLLYTMVDIDRTLLLSNLIFKDRKDKIMFLKQYMKLFGQEDAKTMKKSY